MNKNVPSSKICTRCKEEKSLTQYQKGRVGTPKEYYFSYCNKCRGAAIKYRLTLNFDSYLTQRLGVIRRRNMDKPFDIDVSYIKNLFELQKNKCFYTGYELTFGFNKGLGRNSLSIDKVIPELGYVQGNIVLCSVRANTIKSDVTLEEMKEWMPKWYRKLKKAKFVTSC